MKRVIPVLILLAILFAFAGCDKPYEAADNTEVASTQSSSHLDESDSPTDLMSSTLQVPMISVSMPIVREIEYASDSTEIFRHVYQNMALILPEPEVADKVIVDFLNRVDQTSADAASIKAAAKENYIAENWTPYLCQISYVPTRIDAGVLSLYGNYATYSGSVHPESADVSVNYDLVTGDVIKLDSLFTAESTDMLVAEVTQVLNAQKEEKFLFDDFDDTVKDRFNRGLSHENSWYFSNTGLCFYFSAYDIAPYSSGVIVAEIPYEKLAGFMDNAYFPAETESVTGILQAELFQDDSLDKYEGFSEIVIDQGATKALLHTDSSIYDVRIETGSWSADGDIFIADHTVYAAYALTAGNAIMVESEIPDTLPRLRITYKTGGQTARYYLTDSGKDGSIILMEE